MENKINTILSAESKAEAMIVEAREEGERKLVKLRGALDQERRALDEEMLQAHENIVAEARESAEKELEEIRKNEEEQARALRELGMKRVDEAGELILNKLLWKA